MRGWVLQTNGLGNELARQNQRVTRADPRALMKFLIGHGSTVALQAHPRECRHQSGRCALGIAQQARDGVEKEQAVVQLCREIIYNYGKVAVPRADHGRQDREDFAAIVIINGHWQGAVFDRAATPIACHASRGGQRPVF